MQTIHVGLTALSFMVSIMSNKSPGSKNETAMSFVTFLCVYVCDEIVFMLNNVMNIKQREVAGKLTKHFLL